MKKLVCFLLVSGSLFLFPSCESCTRNVTKKVTKIGLSAVEGVSEAVNEHGEKVSEKAMDALGTVAKGAGRSLDRQLDEHADHVAGVVGRTFVQSVEGFDKGLTAEYYDEIQTQQSFCSGVSLEFFGKIKSKSVVDAYFIVLEKGNYNCKFEFVDASGKVLLSKEAVIEKPVEERKYSVVSFAFNEEEEALLAKSNKTNVTVAKK